MNHLWKSLWFLIIFNVISCSESKTAPSNLNTIAIPESNGQVVILKAEGSDIVFYTCANVSDPKTFGDRSHSSLSEQCDGPRGRTGLELLLPAFERAFSLSRLKTRADSFRDRERIETLKTDIEGLKAYIEEIKSYQGISPEVIATFEGRLLLLEDELTELTNVTNIVREQLEAFDEKISDLNQVGAEVALAILSSDVRVIGNPSESLIASLIFEAFRAYSPIERKFLPTKGFQGSFRLQPEENRIFAVSGRQSIVIRRLDSLLVERQLDFPDRYISNFEVSPEGILILETSFQGESSLSTWDIETGQLLHEILDNEIYDPFTGDIRLNKDGSLNVHQREKIFNLKIPELTVRDAWLKEDVVDIDLESLSHVAVVGRNADGKPTTLTRRRNFEDSFPRQFELPVGIDGLGVAHFNETIAFASSSEVKLYKITWNGLEDLITLPVTDLDGRPRFTDDLKFLDDGNALAVLVGRELLVFDLSLSGAATPSRFYLNSRLDKLSELGLTNDFFFVELDGEIAIFERETQNRIDLGLSPVSKIDSFKALDPFSGVAAVTREGPIHFFNPGSEGYTGTIFTDSRVSEIHELSFFEEPNGPWRTGYVTRSFRDVVFWESKPNPYFLSQQFFESHPLPKSEVISVLQDKPLLAWVDWPHTLKVKNFEDGAEDEMSFGPGIIDSVALLPAEGQAMVLLGEKLMLTDYKEQKIIKQLELRDPRNYRLRLNERQDAVEITGPYGDRVYGLIDWRSLEFLVPLSKRIFPIGLGRVAILEEGQTFRESFLSIFDYQDQITRHRLGPYDEIDELTSFSDSIAAVRIDQRTIFINLESGLTVPSLSGDEGFFGIQNATPYTYSGIVFSSGTEIGILFPN
ncbi:MAG: hypothetical protein HRU19_24550 [Pseudobacteriovorax sp.]|nr:hypothetical protein [Pseudobacteriovorax sp.]